MSCVQDSISDIRNTKFISGLKHCASTEFAAAFSFFILFQFGHKGDLSSIVHLKLKRRDNCSNIDLSYFVFVFFVKMCQVYILESEMSPCTQSTTETPKLFGRTETRLSKVTIRSKSECYTKHCTTDLILGQLKMTHFCNLIYF